MDGWRDGWRDGCTGTFGDVGGHWGTLGDIGGQGNCPPLSPLSPFVPFVTQLTPINNNRRVFRTAIVISSTFRLNVGYQISPSMRMFIGSCHAF